MILKAPTCPTCNGQARTIAESVETRAHLRRVSGDCYGYDQWTDTDLHWDTAAPLIDSQGRVSVFCERGHGWKSEVIPVAPPVVSQTASRQSNSVPGSGPPPLPSHDRKR